jgi:nickel/cobalt transporter regulator
MKPIALIASLLAATSLLAGPVLAQAKPCPPGLAKKNPPCVPPGLAKKGVSTGEYVSHRYKIGDRLRDDDDYLIMDDWWEYGLPDPRNDELYVRIDNEIFRIASTTFLVLQAWRAVRDLSN